MKHSRIAIFTAAIVLAAFLPTVAIAQQSDEDNQKRITAPSSQNAVSGDEQASPAQQRIAAARQQIQASPQKAQAYTELALALVRRARETEDPVYFRDAEEALAAGLKLAPGDFELEKARVALLLGEQRFAEAKKEATALNHQTPDDVTTYGYLAEADIALGDYHDAEVSAQWMLNLLPYNVSGLLIAAQLRELFGDPEGALECLQRAYAETSPGETEELAWISNQIASVEIGSGHLDAAVRALDQAEQVFPQYPYTRENRARALQAQGNSAQAGSLLRELPQTPRVLYELAKAESAAGHSIESKRAYADFVKSAKPLTNAPVNANRELILYYADHAVYSGNAQQALDLAQREIKLRQDVWTLDAYAWALYVNGKFKEGEGQIEKALAVGIRSDQLFDHAGHIASKINKQDKAAQYFESVLQIHSSPEYLEDARAQLAGRNGNPVQQSSIVAPPVVSSPPPEINPANETDLIPVATAASGTEWSHVPANLLTPLPAETDRIIKAMQHRIVLNPRQPAAYSGLGAAYLQKARETGDVEDYQLAEQSLNKSLDLVSTDISASMPLTAMAELCMGEHRFSDALHYAQKALALGPGDLSPFAIVGDAYADMGEYEKAGAAYARLLPDSASDNPLAYVHEARLAYLKFISGNTEDAIRQMKKAITAGMEARLKGENLAWLYFELGEFEFQDGHARKADDAYLTALTIHPGDYRALAGLARVRATQGRYEDAITLYQKAIAVVPMPAYISELGDVYSKIGNTAEAEKQFQLVEYIGLLGHINQVLHNRDLALFYSDHDRNLSGALTLARQEFEVRHDIYTWDALAWALYKNSKYQEAGTAIDHALHFGTKDPLLLFHAGMIEARLGNVTKAQDHLSQALKINPQFHIVYADQARQHLTLLEKQPIQTANGMSSNDQNHIQ